MIRRKNGSTDDAVFAELKAKCSGAEVHLLPSENLFVLDFNHALELKSFRDLLENCQTVDTNTASPADLLI